MFASGNEEGFLTVHMLPNSILSIDGKTKQWNPNLLNQSKCTAIRVIFISKFSLFEVHEIRDLGDSFCQYCIVRLANKISQNERGNVNLWLRLSVAFFMWGYRLLLHNCKCDKHNIFVSEVPCLTYTSLAHVWDQFKPSGLVEHLVSLLFPFF